MIQRVLKQQNRPRMHLGKLEHRGQMSRPENAPLTSMRNESIESTYCLPKIKSNLFCQQTQVCLSPAVDTNQVYLICIDRGNEMSGVEQTNVVSVFFAPVWALIFPG